MIAQILSRTPIWVFVLFVVLVALGLWQLRESTKSVRRVWIFPIVFLIWAAISVGIAFKGAALPLIAWAASYATVAWGVSRIAVRAPTRYDAPSQSFVVAGSMLPLLLMMGIFFMHYAVAVSEAMQLSFIQTTGFSLAVGVLYGAFSGAFAGRSWQLIRLIPRKMVS